MNAGSKLWRSVLVAVVILVAPSMMTAQKPILSYQRRGHGTAERREGTLKQPVDASFSLISATVVKDAFSAQQPAVLYVQFFMPQAGNAYVRASELNLNHSYRMTPLQERWNAGWVSFGPWPTADVLGPLGIPSAELGVVVTEKPADWTGSGRIFPAVVTTSGAGGRVSRYEFVVRSDTGLSSFVWQIHPAPKGKLVASAPAQKLVSGQALLISVDASGWPEGVYRLRSKGDLSTPSGLAPVRKHFDFHHVASFPGRTAKP